MKFLPSQVSIAIGLTKQKALLSCLSKSIKYSLQANKLRICPFVQSIIAKSSATVVCPDFFFQILFFPFSYFFLFNVHILLSLEISAETHCSILTKKGTVFEKCHAVVNPIPFYKVGNYDRRCTEGVQIWTKTS